MAHSTDPFTPSTPLSRELLERYAQGRLTDGERHAVELHLESDPAVPAQRRVASQMLGRISAAPAAWYQPGTSPSTHQAPSAP